MHVSYATMKRAFDNSREENDSKRYKTTRTKVVLNKCFGGFGLSEKGVQRLMSLLGVTAYDKRHVAEVLETIPRHNVYLVQVVEELGTDAWVLLCDDEYLHRPMVVEIPVSDNDYEIIYRDGWECAIPRNFESIINPKNLEHKKMRLSEVNDCPRNRMYEQC